MTFDLDRRSLLKIALLLALAALLVVFVAISVARILSNTNRLPAQLDKVVAAGQLHDHLVQESYAIRGYMLYRSPAYLSAFRARNAANRREIEELLQVVRPARQPLVRQVLEKHDRYTRICEEEIIPRVAAGDTAGAARVAVESGAVTLIQQIVDLVGRLQEMRLADTRALADQTRKRVVHALVFGCGLGVVILAAVFGSVSLTLGRTALENTTFRLILRLTPVGVAVLRRDGRVHFLNRAAASLLGVDREAAAGRPWAALVGERLRVCGAAGEASPLPLPLTGGEGLRDAELVYTAPDGRRLFFLADGEALQTERGRVLGAVLVLRDITARKEEEERLRQMSVRDGLTLAFNHRYMQEALEREVEAALGSGAELGFLLLDVDDFKAYNDRFGHPMGDRVLRELARVLQENVREGDIVARYGGDEFAVILPGAGEEVAREVAERLRQAIAAHPFPYRELMPHGRITVSAGVASLPAHGVTAANLIRQAEEAMYAAKHRAKDRVEVASSLFAELEAEWPGAAPLLHNVAALLRTVHAKDRYTYTHSERVARHAAELAHAAGMDDGEVKKLRLAAFLHDVGKIAVSRQLLNKPEPLTPEEWEVIKRHPAVGAEIVGQIKGLEEIVPLVLHHHERWDGNGYPAGLTGEAIPLGARIIALADAFDAMTTHRPYQPAKTGSEALRELRREAGRQFDPHLAEIFARIVPAAWRAPAVTDPAASGKPARA